MDPRLKRLGRELAEAEEAALRTFDTAPLRARFLAAAHGDSVRSRPWRKAAYALATAALAVLVYLARPVPLSFAIAGTTGREGEWIAAPASSSVSLTFSDGSQVDLSARARARVLDSASNGARVVLEHGKIVADVVHRSGTRWRVDAGPFEVHVVGTRFEVSWDAVEERLGLVLLEGAVRVVGPTLPRGRTVVAGETLDLTLSPTHQPAHALPARAHTDVPVPEAGDVREPSFATPVASGWRSLATHGDHRRAFRAAASWGFLSVARSASLADLSMLADIARLSGHPAQAATALIALRTRFPAHPRAGDAAFLLGRLYYDQLAAPDQAARWFARYLNERPEGQFAREAAGRLLESYQQLKRTSAARDAAKRYLAAYPTGPHAPLARSVLDDAQRP